MKYISIFIIIIFLALALCSCGYRSSYGCPSTRVQGPTMNKIKYR